jgi:hypothetical protein
MTDMKPQTRRTNRVFKSLHKPLTYLGVERTLFYFVCVGAVGAFNLFNSILAGIAVFIGGFPFSTALRISPRSGKEKISSLRQNGQDRREVSIVAFAPRSTNCASFRGRES